MEGSAYYLGGVETILEGVVDNIMKDMNMPNNLMIENMIGLRYIKYALS